MRIINKYLSAAENVALLITSKKFYPALWSTMATSKEEPWVESKKADALPGSRDDEVQPDSVGVGELAFEEYTQGGLGRHLGLFSTTFLVYAPFALAFLLV